MSLKHHEHRANDIQTQNCSVEDPEVIEVLHNFLKLRWNVDVYVVIEARLDAEFVGQRRPIVTSHTSCVAITQKLCFAPLEFRCFPFELFLSSLIGSIRKQEILKVK